MLEYSLEIFHEHEPCAYNDPVTRHSTQLLVFKNKLIWITI